MFGSHKRVLDAELDGMKYMGKLWLADKCWLRRCNCGNCVLGGFGGGGLDGVVDAEPCGLF